MSATPDSTLADSSRTIADLRRELAECKAERDAALALAPFTANLGSAIGSGSVVPTGRPLTTHWGEL
jgi:hypothetical protein